MSDISLHEERLKRFRDAGLYLVTSQLLSNGRSTPQIVKAALEGGCRLIQLREKQMPLRDLLALAREVRAMTAGYDALLIINDRIDVALAVDADGVHLGQDDFLIEDARRLAPDMLLGASTHNEEEAREAQVAGASYVNIGPLFPTRTKEWTDAFLGVEGLRRISREVHTAFSVMGGIKQSHIAELVKAGARTIALVTAVTAAEDPRAATEVLLREIHAAGAGETKMRP